MLSRVAVVLSHAQILTLDSSPVQLIPAPGANRIINVVSVFYSYRFGTVPYFIAGTPAIATFYGNDTGLRTPQDFGYTNLTASASNNTSASAVGGGSQAISGVNQPLVAAVVSVDPTGGDGTLKVVVYYTVESP